MASEYGTAPVYWHPLSGCAEYSMTLLIPILRDSFVQDISRLVSYTDYPTPCFYPFHLEIQIHVIQKLLIAL